MPQETYNYNNDQNESLYKPPFEDVSTNTVNLDEPQTEPITPPLRDINYVQENESSTPEEPIYSNLTQRHDFISNIISILRTYPGKSAYIISLVGALFFSLFPWTGTLFTTNSYNYFYFLGRNFFCGIYIVGILGLLFIRYSIWTGYKPAKPYLKTMDFLETLFVGAITMFTFTIGSFGDIQFGLALSAAFTLVALSYISYLKLVKNK